MARHMIVTVQYHMIPVLYDIILCPYVRYGTGTTPSAKVLGEFFSIYSGADASPGPAIVWRGLTDWS